MQVLDKKKLLYVVKCNSKLINVSIESNTDET